MSETIDIQWLLDNGVEANESELQHYLNIVTTEWEIRVGYAIAEHLTDTQVDEFDRLTDEDEQIKWLSGVYPKYPEVVSEISEQLAEELQAAKNKTDLIIIWEKEQRALQ